MAGHIRRRPGMYIGKLGDGSSYDDGIYVLLKEVLDNSIDEFMMGFGKTIEVKIEGSNVSVRDYGRGVPLGKVKDVSSKMNTGAKYDSKAFKKSVGLNGVGIKAVNAFRRVFLLKVIVMADRVVWNTNAELWFVKRLRMLQAKATARSCRLRPIPKYSTDMLIGNNLLSRCSKLCISEYRSDDCFNGKKYTSKNGLEDLLNENLTSENLYPSFIFMAKTLK
jgi:topoisomerase-4 subunit B